MILWFCDKGSWHVGLELCKWKSCLCSQWGSLNLTCSECVRLQRGRAFSTAALRAISLLSKGHCGCDSHTAHQTINTFIPASYFWLSAVIIPKCLECFQGNYSNYKNKQQQLDPWVSWSQTLNHTLFFFFFKPIVMKRNLGRTTGQFIS